MATESKGPSFARRDKLIEIQKKAQERWDKEKCFEQDAPAGVDAKNKHFVTFPYPYMNGMLHLGHTFSLSKTEFSMGMFSLLTGILLLLSSREGEGCAGGKLGRLQGRRALTARLTGQGTSV
eukprot:3931853-Rhodomonas_salina.2